MKVHLIRPKVGSFVLLIVVTSIMAGCRAPMAPGPVAARAQPVYLEPGPGNDTGPSLLERAEQQSHQLQEMSRELDRVKQDLLACSEARDEAQASIDRSRLDMEGKDSKLFRLQADYDKVHASWLAEREKRSSVTDMYLSEKILRSRAEADLIQLRLELVDQ